MIFHFLLVLLAHSTEDFVFGYGSLVADWATDPDAWPARIHGLRRCWCYNAWHVNPPQTALGVHVDRWSITTNGLILPVDKKRLKELDLRERDYQRIKFSWSDVEFVDMGKEIPSEESLHNSILWVYALPKSKYESPTFEHPIAVNYVDLCMAGFLTVGNESFAKEFIERTAGWETSYILANRGEKTSSLIPLDAEMYKQIDSMFEKYQPSFLLWKKKRTSSRDIGIYVVISITITSLLIMTLLGWLSMRGIRSHREMASFSLDDNWEERSMLDDFNDSPGAKVTKFESKDWQKRKLG